MKQKVKIVVLSTFPNIRDEIILLLDAVNDQTKNYQYNYINNIHFEKFIAALLDIIKKTTLKNKKENNYIKDNLINDFIMHLCHIYPHFVFFGPIIPGDVIESEMIQLITREFTQYLQIYKSSHQIEKFRPEHQTEFIPVYQPQNNQNDFIKMGFGCLDQIGESFSTNIEILKKYFLQIDQDKSIVSYPVYCTTN